MNISRLSSWRWRARAAASADPLKRLLALRQAESDEWADLRVGLQTLSDASCDRRQKSRARFNEALRKLYSKRADD